MKLLVLHGPNLNMLGYRNKVHYGTLTYEKLCELINTEASTFAEVEFFQSNSEGDLIDELHRITFEQFDAVLLNLGAYSHTSIALHDALEIFQGLKVEVHLSDVKNRESFRQTLITARACDKMFSGKKEQSYIEAIAWLEKNR